MVDRGKEKRVLHTLLIVIFPARANITNTQFGVCPLHQ